MAKRFTPVIGLAVVVALAMAAVFGAMSLADPAQAAIDRSPLSAMAVTTVDFMDDDATEGDEVTVRPAVLNSDGTVRTPAVIRYEDDEFTVDNFAGRGPDAPTAPTVLGPTYVIEFELTGAFNVGDDRILIELPAGAEGEPADANAPATITAAQVEVRGPRYTTVPTGSNVTLGDRADLEGTTVVFAYPDADTTIGYARSSNLVENEGAKHLILTLDGAMLNSVALGRAADATTIRPVEIRVTVTGMTNPTQHGANDINIYHYTDDNPATAAVDDPAIVGQKRTASLHISSAKVEALKDGDDLTGEYQLTFFAQESYVARTSLDIEMGGVSFTYDEIDPADVSITIDGTPRNPRGVELNSGTATVSLELATAIRKGDEVVIDFLDSAGITNPTRTGTYAWVVDEDYSTLGNNGLVVAEADLGEVTEDDITDEAVSTVGYPSFVPDSNDPGKNTRYTVKFDVEEEVNTLLNDLVIEFHEDYSVPASIATSAVTIRTGPYPDDTNVGTGETVDAGDEPDYYTFTPRRRGG